MVTLGVPGPIRSDSGPEFAAKAVREWLELVDGEALFIGPEQPVGARVRGELDLGSSGTSC